MRRVYENTQLQVSPMIGREQIYDRLSGMSVSEVEAFVRDRLWLNNDRCGADFLAKEFQDSVRRFFGRALYQDAILRMRSRLSNSENGDGFVLESGDRVLMVCFPGELREALRIARGQKFGADVAQKYETSFMPSIDESDVELIAQLNPSDEDPGMISEHYCLDEVWDIFTQMFGDFQLHESMQEARLGVTDLHAFLYGLGYRDEEVLDSHQVEKIRYLYTACQFQDDIPMVGPKDQEQISFKAVPEFMDIAL